MKYSEEQVNDFIAEALSLAATSPIYDARVENGVLRYTQCLVGRHSLKNSEGVFHVTACDSSVVVAVSDAGVTKIVYNYDLEKWKIIPRQYNEPRTSLGELLDDVPGIGSIHTHHTNGNPYMVVGYLNDRAREASRQQYPLIVIYIGQNGYMWGKTAERFAETMHRGGQFQFQENVQIEYMGIVENDCLINGYMTRKIEQLANQGTTKHE